MSAVRELERWIIENKDSDFIVDVNGGGSSGGGHDDNKIRVEYSEDGRTVENVGFTGDVNAFLRGAGLFSRKSEVYVTENMCPGALKKHFKDIVSWYKDNGKVGWIPRSEYFKSKGKEYVSSLAARMTELRDLGVERHIHEGDVCLCFIEKKEICFKVL